MQALIAKGALGQKTGAGIFMKKGKDIVVLDLKAQDYRPAAGEAAPEVVDILKTKNPAEKFAKLRASQHPQAKFLWSLFRDLFHYSAYHLASIRRHRARCRFRHPLGLRLVARPVRDLAGRRLEAVGAVDRRGHRRGRGHVECAAARLGVRWPRRACMRPRQLQPRDREGGAALVALGLPAPALPRSHPRREIRARRNRVRDRRRADVARRRRHRGGSASRPR